MKVLLDENLPHELRLLLMPMHEVFTVAFLGWSALENGDLLLQAASNGFDAMIYQGSRHRA
jgi:predicted nuclease of predicted toxin-antitoxin system